MNRYVKNIEKDLAAMMQQKPKRTEGKGLLSPKKTANADTPTPKSTRDFVLNLTADIRRKRLSVKGTA
jgi:hypothetical protein